MSSTIDFFDCPACGGFAQREQDNKTCEVYYNCIDCGWQGEQPVKTESRYWIDDDPFVKPFNDENYGIVDENAGGVIIYIGNFILARLLINLLEKDENKKP